MGRKNKKKRERIIVILQAEIKNDVVEELKQADGDEKLEKVILTYKTALEDKGVEIFEVFDYFLVCEEGIYIALYEDEVKQVEDGL